MKEKKTYVPKTYAHSYCTYIDLDLQLAYTKAQAIGLK